MFPRLRAIVVVVVPTSNSSLDTILSAVVLDTLMPISLPQDPWLIALSFAASVPAVSPATLNVAFSALVFLSQGAIKLSGSVASLSFVLDTLIA